MSAQQNGQTSIIERMEKKRLEIEMNANASRPTESTFSVANNVNQRVKALRAIRLAKEGRLEPMATTPARGAASTQGSQDPFEAVQQTEEISVGGDYFASLDDFGASESTPQESESDMIMRVFANEDAAPQILLDKVETGAVSSSNPRIAAISADVQSLFN